MIHTLLQYLVMGIVAALLGFVMGKTFVKLYGKGSKDIILLLTLLSIIGMLLGITYCYNRMDTVIAGLGLLLGFVITCEVEMRKRTI